MKRFFAKASKPFALPNKPGSEATQNIGHGHASAPTSTVAHTPGLQPKYVVPPVPHPYPYEHLTVLVAKDGLLIRPHITDQGEKVVLTSYIRLSWGKHLRVEEILSTGEEYDWSESAVIYGIVGVLELYSTSYLFVITSRFETGSILDASNKVYGIKGVVAIPLQEDHALSAVKTISSRNAVLERPSLLPRGPTSDSMAGVTTQELNTPHMESPVISPPRVQFLPDPEVKLVTPIREDFNENETLRPSSPQSISSGVSTPSSEHSSTTTPVFSTVAAQLSFWNRLSKRKLVDAENNTVSTPLPQTPAQEQEALDKIMLEAKGEPVDAIRAILDSTAPPPATTEERHSELEDKVVRECIRQFAKGGMYFSYTFDVTRSLQHKQEQLAKSLKQHELLAGLGALPSSDADRSPAVPVPGTKLSAGVEPNSTLPLWRRVDKQFWWNEWMSKHFIDAGLHSFVLPIMQGYLQKAQFVVPSELGEDEEECQVDYIIISRRSRDRAGLRYQRRGVDEEAHVANFVETETIIRVEREGRENIFSYVQIRGSIPLFWTQSGYGLKPPPVLASNRTHNQNLDALQRHLQRTVPLYGPHTIVNLAERQGKEGAITQAYCDCVRELGFQDVQYHEYDFHTETRGMKYENISKLIDTMERTFETQGYLWICDNTVLSQQKGVFRVNCIDCLDRTNVVQSAFARHIMQRQLGVLALLNPSVTKRPEMDLIFNDVWANNGDAISRAYAGTSALKGDFTRTGRRDLSGLLNDGVNSLARMYTSTFSDWFCQAVIDFMLGNRTISVLSEFLLKLQSSDPRDLIRLSKIRTEAIATSVARVLPEGERLLSGWTLFAPEELNSKISLKFEEKVLLLTMQALYIVSYDYSLEKVKLYTRIPLQDVIGISKGAYILSPLEEASRDPDQNAGFVITWMNSNQESRATSYCVGNSLHPPSDGTLHSGIPSKGPTTSILPPQTQTWSLRNSTRAPSRLSTISSLTSTGIGKKCFAAFKALPIDPARMRRGTSTSSAPYAETSEEVAGASNCKEVVDRIAESIHRAYQDIGKEKGDFMINEDVVSLTEAQRTTTMYAKMEYGVKRLLWLGG